MGMSLTNAHEVIQRIARSLFSAEERRLEKVKDQLVASNKECFPDRPHDGFTYKGVPYDPSNLTKGARTRVSLHLSLSDQMDEYLEDKEKVWTDRHYISQMLFTLLHPCDSAQDIRDALPNCIVDTLDDIKQLRRVREAAYTIQDNKMNHRQYLKILPRMEFYATARLLY
jgi:hypothetical protein